MKDVTALAYNKSGVDTSLYSERYPDFICDRGAMGNASAICILPSTPNRGDEISRNERHQVVRFRPILLSSTLLFSVSALLGIRNGVRESVYDTA